MKNNVKQQLNTNFHCLYTRDELIFSFQYLPQVKEEVRELFIAGWSFTQHVNVIPASMDCFLGRIILLNRYTFRLRLSVIRRHCDWCAAADFTNPSEDSRAPSAGGSGRLPRELLAGSVQLASDR